MPNMRIPSITNVVVTGLRIKSPDMFMRGPFKPLLLGFLPAFRVLPPLLPFLRLNRLGFVPDFHPRAGTKQKLPFSNHLFSRGKALLLNFLSGLTALLGVIACFVFRSFVEPNLPWFMAISGGMFIYIAAAGLIPELHHARWRNSWISTVPLLAGIALMAALSGLSHR